MAVVQRISLTRDGAAIALELAWIAGPAQAPLIVFLHEGLGSIAIWKDWPAQVCMASGCRGLVVSRHGYGRSTPRPAPWPLDYMEQEARVALPALFRALGIDTTIEKPVLYGHSDGGSIALLHAAAFPAAVAAVIVEAPHVLAEQVGIARIAALCSTYPGSPLQAHLARLHDAPDAVFAGWSGAWTAPAFRDWNVTSALPSITAPLLAIQGVDDQYGSLLQLDEIKRCVPQAELLKLEACRHVPHEEQPAAVLAAVRSFVGRVNRPAV